MSQRAPGSPPRQGGARIATVVSLALAWVALLTALVVLNVRGRSVPAFLDLDNPFAEPWYAEDRIEHGWPLTAHRRFVGEVDPAVVAPGRFDTFGIALDAVVLLSLCAGMASASVLMLRKAPR